MVRHDALHRSIDCKSISAMGSPGRLASGADDSLVVHKPRGSEVRNCSEDQIPKINNTRAFVFRRLTYFIIAGC